jgi:ELWxxDGT repeat protein
MKGRTRLIGTSLTTALAAALFCVLPADGFELVADINQGAIVRPVYAGWPGTEISTGSFVPMNDSTHGVELWFSDGTPAGTRLIKDIFPGWGSSLPVDFTRFGDTVVFQANDGVHGTELWRSDGTTAGTYMLADIGPGSQSFGGTLPGVAIDGVLYFAADDGVTGNELWRTDGTRDGTYLVADIVPGYAGSNPKKLTVVGESILFLREGQIWLSDGTSAGTRKVLDINVFRCCQVVGDAIFFTADDGTHGMELWQMDADGGNPHMVVNMNTAPMGPTQDQHSDPEPMFQRGNSLVFSAYVPNPDPNSGGRVCMMYRADASGTGVVELGDFGSRCPGAANINLPGGSLFTVLSNSPPYDIPALWVTDGTPEGTMPLGYDMYFSEHNSYFDGLRRTKVAYGPNGDAYFFGRASTVGANLPPDKVWLTDGTRAGTRIFADLTTHSRNLEVVHLNGRVYFDTAQFGVDPWNDELWTSDGTPAGTFRVREIGSFNASIVALRPANGQLQFFATGLSGGLELWHSDGTRDGTLNLITNSAVSSGNGSSNVAFAGRLGTRVLFTADRTAGNEGHELLVTDGTSAGTAVVRALFSDGPGDPGNFLPFGDQWLFVASDHQRRRGLWRTDGTSGGTIPLQTVSINNDARVLLGDASTIIGGVAYFTVDPGGVGLSYRELWRTDGTQAGTFEVTGNVGQRVNILGGNGTHLLYQALANGTTMHLWSWDGSQAQIITAADTLNIVYGAAVSFNGRVCFRAWDVSPSRIDVWCANGQPGDLVRATNLGSIGATAGDLHLLDDKLLVNVPGSGSASGLYVTAGSPAGTQRISNEEMADAKPFGSGQIVFVSKSKRLMLTDGTNGGTRDLLEGVNLPGALAGGFGILGSHVVFVINDPARGAVIWRTDGAASGTRYLADLDPGTSSAPEGQFFTLGDRLLFSGYRTSIGNELWSINATDPNASDDASAATGGVAATVNVLDNDADFDGTLNAATVAVVMQPAHGTATVNAATGAITYTATASYSGRDSLTYRVSDDQGRPSNAATLSFQVTAGATPPSTPPPTPPSGGGSGKGGGGALGLDLVGLLAFAVWARLRHPCLTRVCTAREYRVS